MFELDKKQQRRRTKKKEQKVTDQCNGCTNSKAEEKMTKSTTFSAHSYNQQGRAAKTRGKNPHTTPHGHVSFQGGG